MNLPASLRAAVLPAAMVALCLPLATPLDASTGCFVGKLLSLRPPTPRSPADSGEDQRLVTPVLQSVYVVYQSNAVRRTGEVLDSYSLRRDTSPAVEGMLTSPAALHNALPHLIGSRMYIYESSHWDVALSPDFAFGRLRGWDPQSNVLTIESLQTNRRFHYSENPILLSEHKLDRDAAFMVEPWKPISIEQARERVGRWVQVHPPRKQIIWVETPAARWDPSVLPTPADNRPRGGANALTNNALFEGYAMARFDVYGGRWYRGLSIITRQDLKRMPDDFERLQLDRKIEPLKDGTVRVIRGSRSDAPFTEGQTLDRHAVPYFVAQRPGRMFVSCHYRKEFAPHERYFQTMDDRFHGTIVELADGRLVIDATMSDGRTERVNVPIEQDGRTFLDGQLVQLGAGYAPGQFIRFFPPRPTQTVLLLDEYHVSTPSIRNEADLAERPVRFCPAAYFTASELVLNKKAEVHFDASFSYHPEGTKIVSWEWSFGDGSTATGPKISRTFAPQGPYRRELVRLTVTDENGLKNQWIEYVEITDGLMAAQKVDREKLKPGMVLDVYKSGALSDLAGSPARGNVNRGITNWFFVGEKQAPSGSVKRYQGWFEVGRSGEYELRAAGPIGDSLLQINGVTVIDTGRTEHYGDGKEGFLQQRARVHLEKGWHRFDLVYSNREHTLSITGEGLLWPNDFHDIGPVFHTPEQAGDAREVLWYTGEPSSRGRGVVDRDGKAPDRSLPPGIDDQWSARK